MGDLFFVIRMTIYTLILVVIMQVKVGPTTLEQKVYEFTHHSQLAGSIQKVAQGAASFIGVQYRQLTGQMQSKYIEQLSASQRPGERLKAKIQELKKSMNKKWEENKSEISDQIEDINQ